ncbi:hypothetical protein M407DRAFT_106193 [Tulasnella calospora MUT 4182]|uniref:Secreted protein n=1 Tax=Tulasnella calospora MUT 4182 TaxID=1051891 RepID=A0A0C3KR98_9AGAM|nr:hypothetical protein M407DRAFT_106193 [Tulasnella calospora MUT 4182]
MVRRTVGLTSRLLALCSLASALLAFSGTLSSPDPGTPFGIVRNPSVRHIRSKTDRPSCPRVLFCASTQHWRRSGELSGGDRCPQNGGGGPLDCGRPLFGYRLSGGRALPSVSWRRGWCLCGVKAHPDLD